jgi:maltose alpha-D-glucosyltransferase/alpha-amylase
MIEQLWYKNAVIYSLDLETFMDANGDGIGDFEGLSQKLHYLHALGVDTIWLAPFQPTPNKDNGYDIADYYGVDQRHGCLGDFVAFMHLAHKLGMKVIIDLVVNHTSDQHPWFVESRKSRNSPFRDWYVWSDKRPDNWKEGIVFHGVQETTWTYDKQTKSYYFHRFYPHQPDLNTEHPAVKKEIQKIMGFWLQLGVAGFRVDAVPFILESPSPAKKPKMRFDYLHDMRRFLQWRKGEAVLLGEANVLPKESINYFGEQSNGIHLMFNFYVNQYLFYALATGEIEPFKKALEETRLHLPASQWAHFLRNHDELDLGRLTEEQRQKVFEQFGPEENMQLYGRGIRRRLAPMLGNRQRLEFAYSLMFALPGTPVMRYGDEIAMGENLSLNERDAVRTPMQWTREKNAGFSTADKVIHPVIDEGYYAYRQLNVEDEQRDTGSLLHWMTAMIRLRKQCPEIGLGEWKILPTKQPQLLHLFYQWNERCLLVVHNFSAEQLEVKLSIKEASGNKLIDLIGKEEITESAPGKFTIALNAHGYRWFRLRPEDA